MGIRERINQLHNQSNFNDRATIQTLNKVRDATIFGTAYLLRKGPLSVKFTRMSEDTMEVQYFNNLQSNQAINTVTMDLRMARWEYKDLLNYGYT